jgi:pyruvate-ferredoxin/flavodoxin oxidoreductase
MTWACIDGNEAASRVAYSLSEVLAIYPITPASPMGESVDVWSGTDRPNLWGDVPAVVEMQSEGGAAGALHGAVQAGALGSTFTASQGLLLMVPTMFKVAGELTPTVIHVAARALATHALSIFGDHSDVMSTRSTGFAMLASNDVQEAHDLALVAHAATLRARVPFLHFFDGFRTSHEINKVALLEPSDLRALIREDDVAAHRRRGLSPERPVVRGTAQNPDVFFASREASNRFYDAVPGIVADVMDEFATRVGRRYHLVDYVGHPQAEQVLVLMGSASGAVREVIDAKVAAGERVGAVLVRLYRPFPVEQVAAAIPATARAVAVMDRTKEPGAPGEPLYLDVLSALHATGRGALPLVGARYGLGSAEVRPRDIAALLDYAAAYPDSGNRRFVTLGLDDDVTHLSLATDDSYRVPTTAVQAVFFGLGSDGTVGANKTAITIIGEQTDSYAQGYFVYDSKKAGSVTVSHLRFGPDPITSTYLVEDGSADFVACHQFSLLDRMDVLSCARSGATLLLNAPYSPDELWDHLPAEVQQTIMAKGLDVWVIDAHKVSRELGLGARINTVMQPCFFSLSKVLPEQQALSALKDAVRSRYSKRGPSVVERNLAAIDSALAGLQHVTVPEVITGRPRSRVRVPEGAEQFLAQVTAPLIAGEGDRLPVSLLPADGTFPTGTAALERRALALEMPVWDPSICIDCGKCAIVCPHAAIRLKVYPDDTLAAAPAGFQSKGFRDRQLTDHRLTVQVAPDDCTGCGICVDVCPARSKEDSSHKALDLAPAQHRREVERPAWSFFLSIPEVDRTAVKQSTVKGSQLLQPLFEFSGACSGCGETPYLKLLSQLYGDRLVVANATGCSSIYGGNLPTTPWSRGPDGRGPAWSNSLFEDNAEFGLGLRLGIESHTAAARRLITDLGWVLGDELVSALLLSEQADEREVQAQRARVEVLQTRIARLIADGDTDERLPRLAELAENLVRRSVWAVGGDGWAYDIGFGGLDQVLSSDQDINVLVMDTEVYSNTGGQASKSTPRGATAKFAVSGKSSAKKDLGAFARAYGNVYVAQIAIGANETQTVRALLEADAWRGPSLVIAYSTCIAHGIDMSTSMTHQKAAVSSGYWELYRYSPTEDEHAQPFQLDSRAPSTPLRDFLLAETRFSALARSNPSRARELFALAQHDVSERRRYYEQLAGVERAIAHVDGGDPDVGETDEEELD